MSRIFALCCCVLQLGLLINASGLYSVIGPGTIRSNYKYNVAVSVHKAEGKSVIKVGITGPSYNESKQIEVEPMSTKNVEFDVPKLSSGDYNLTAAGIEGIIFENSTKLNYADNKPSIYIQTDKATYKPADLVQFRVIFLDANTRPAVIDGPIKIEINDGAQNLIKQVSDIKLTKGVYAGELQLSDQPVLGNWNLAVKVGDEGAETKSFEVAKYVLPKFEVVVETDKDVVAEDGLIKATIRAKYTYGKPVKGKATVSLTRVRDWYSSEESLNQNKTIDVNGKGHVEFTGSLSSTYLSPLKVFAEVTEELTGNKQNASATVNLHAQRYKLEGIDSPSTYHPDKVFTYKLAVKNVDGTPVRDTAKKVKLSFGSPYGMHYHHSYPYPRQQEHDQNEEKKYEFEAPLGDNGIAIFNVTLPQLDRSYLHVSGSYADVTSNVGSISKYEQSRQPDKPLSIEVNTKNPKLRKNVSFDVIAQEPIPYFVYAIIARGNIVKAEHVAVPEGRMTHTIKFEPTFEMVPKASIYVYYAVNNELRFIEKTIDFDKDFENSIEITAPIDVKPSEEVKLQVKTNADSYVGLLGVDQSVLLLKSGNDLSKDDVFNGLNKYETSTPWQHGYGSYPGQSSGLVTLTNINYPYSFEEEEPEVYYLLSIGGESEDSEFTIETSTSQPPQITVRMEFPENWIFDNVERPLLRLPSPQLTGLRTISAAGVGIPQNPMLPSAGAFVPPSISPPQIRKEFSETWIFQDNITTDADGFTLAKKIPDTITSWVVTGFSLSPNKGFALTENPSKIRVFQPFFVSTNLPYSVKRGEVISVPVIIFNYMEKALEAEVTMDNIDKEYEFTEATNEVEEKSIDEIRRVKRVAIPANNGATISFMIRPKKVGDITLKITALSPLAGDTIHQKLKVEPEGVTQFENRAVFINLQNKTDHSQELKVDIPTEAVSDSEYIEFSVVGDLLGPTIKNLDNLVRMPYGCGEQNMVNFVPNILVVKYLEVTNRKMPNVVAKAKKFMEVGYQRELSYKHDDGSYSAFGKSDASGSTWLTAYVVRSFHQAAKYTDVDPKVIVKGLDFLASKQKDNGEFPEVGKLFDNANQNALGLTSFVLIAFFENDEVIEKYRETVSKAIEYVAQEVDKTDDQYSLSIAAVALHLAKHPQAAKVLAKMQSVSKQEDGRKWWTKDTKTDKEESERLWYHPKSKDVEITSYMLMVLLEEAPAEESLPIIKWLIAQRNSNGGFSSTQDTVIGLQALTKFAYKTGSGTGTMDIDFVSSGGTEADNKDTIKVNPENSLVLQSHVLPKSTRKVDFTAKGQGSAMVQLSYRYNLADKDKKPSFKVTPTVKDTPLQQLTLDVCAEFVPLDSSEPTKDSNMAVMEIALPSGYVGDKDSFDKIESIDRVKRVETKNGDTTVIVYFDSLTPGDVKCLPVEGVRAHAVAKQKPAAVSVYDYYETDRRATEYYQVKSSLCDICEGSDCGEGCKKEA